VTVKDPTTTYIRRYITAWNLSVQKLIYLVPLGSKREDAILAHNFHKCWPIFTGRMPRSGKLPVLNLLRPKIRFFARRGDSLHRFRSNLCRTNGHLGALRCAKFHLNRPRGWECGPKISKKFPLFGKESPRRGDSLDRFPKILGAFIRLTILR